MADDLIEAFLRARLPHHFAFGQALFAFNVRPSGKNVHNGPENAVVDCADQNGLFLPLGLEDNGFSASNGTKKLAGLQ